MEPVTRATWPAAAAGRRAAAPHRSAPARSATLRCRCAGGLPSSWLDPQKRVLGKMAYLDLSNNYLGYTNETATAAVLTKAQWCPDAWDPPGAVDTGVAGSLELLDLSSCGLEGECSARSAHSVGGSFGGRGGGAGPRGGGPRDARGAG